GQHSGELPVTRAGYTQSSGKGLEQRLDLVMVRAPVNRLEVHVGVRAASKALKKIMDQLRLQVANQPCLHLGVYDRSGTSAEVDCSQPQRFIHGHYEISGAHDAALVAQRAVEGFTQGDAHVFHCMVLVDVEITRGSELQVESAMACEQL